MRKLIVVFMAVLAFVLTGSVAIAAEYPEDTGAGEDMKVDGSGLESQKIIMYRYWVSDTNNRAAAIYNHYNTITDEDQLVLGVSGGSGSWASPALYSNARMVIQSNGNVGIGTTEPRAKLDVAGGLLFSTAAGSPGAYSIIRSGADNLQFQGGTAGYRFQNHDSTATLVTIDNGTGDVDVSGVISAADVVVGGVSVATLDEISALQAQVNTLEILVKSLQYIINDLPPGLMEIDRNRDGK